MEDFKEYVPNVRFELIPIKNLVSNQDYQRNLSQTHILRAAEHFDLYQINPVKVSRRDGINYVFNGQHTIEIVAMVSGSRETPVWCMIYDDLCYSHEADIFANQQKYVKSLNPHEVFVANVEAGNDDQLTIKRLVETYGLTITTKKASNTICAVGALESIFTKYGYHVLNRVLRLIVGSWEGDPNSFSANMLNAVAKLVVTYREHLDEDIFKDKVGGQSVKQLGRVAKERRSGSMGYAEAMILAYNGKKKSMHHRLAMNKLYAKDFTIVSDDDFGDDDFFDNIDDDDMELYEGEDEE
jgi:hypothetical protein